MKLEGKIDEIIELLVDGFTYRAIATKYDVSISTLSDYLALTEHSARAKAALDGSADQFADKAEEALLNAPADPIEMTRARELAQHYRWKASKRSPRRYGDKLDLTTDGEKIPLTMPNVIVYNQAPPLATTEDEVEK